MVGLNWMRRPQGPRIILWEGNPPIVLKIQYANTLSLTLIYSKQDTWKRSLIVAQTTRRHSPGAMPA